MADESRSYGTIGGGKDHSYLFDMLKSERKVSQEKELMDHQHTLALGAMKERDVLENRRLEKANEFSKLMQEFRQGHERQMQQEAFARQQAESLANNTAVMDYTGREAVAQADKGNVIPSLVQPNAAAQTPEASIPGAGFEPRPLDPRAANVAHTDLMSGIEARRRTDEAMRLKTLDQTFNRIGPDEVAQAQALAPLFEQYGLTPLALQFKTMKPGSWAKNDFQQAVIKAQGWLEDARARMERARIFSDARIQIATINNEAKQRVAELKAKKDLDKADLAEAREQRLRIGAQIQTVTSGISTINSQLQQLTLSPAERTRLEDELREHKALRENLQNTQSAMFGIEAKYGLVAPSLPKDQTQKYEQAVREIIDVRLKRKGKSYEELSDADKAKVNEIMAREHGVQYR